MGPFNQLISISLISFSNGLLHHTVVLPLILCRASILIPMTTPPMHTNSNSIQIFLFYILSCHGLLSWIIWSELFLLESCTLAVVLIFIAMVTGDVEKIFTYLLTIFSREIWHFKWSLGVLVGILVKNDWEREDWKDGSTVRRIHCSCKGLDWCSQHSCLETLSSL